MSDLEHEIDIEEQVCENPVNKQPNNECERYLNLLTILVVFNTIVNLIIFSCCSIDTINFITINLILFLLYLLYFIRKKYDTQILIFVFAFTIPITIIVWLFLTWITWYKNIGCYKVLAVLAQNLNNTQTEP